MGAVLWLCPSLPTETLKWLSSLPILMQKSFWWWQCSDRYIISLSSHLHTPFSPPLISRTVSVDVKHHVYLLTWWLGLLFGFWVLFSDKTWPRPLSFCLSVSVCLWCHEQGRRQRHKSHETAFFYSAFVNLHATWLRHVHWQNNHTMPVYKWKYLHIRYSFQHKGQAQTNKNVKEFCMAWSSRFSFYF